MELEDNPASNLTLAEKRRALATPRSHFRMGLTVPHLVRYSFNFDYYRQANGSGACGFVAGTQNFIELLTTLGSVSRGIPRKEWKLPLPDLNDFNFAIYPHMDVLAVVERRAG